MSGLPRIGSHRPPRGFTLVEVMVSATLTALLAAGLLTILAGEGNLWRGSEERIETFREARSAVELLKRDLSSIMPARNAPMLVIGNNPPGTPPEDRLNWQLHFVSAIAREAEVGPAATTSPPADKSGLCAVSYYCRWNATAGDDGGARTTAWNDLSKPLTDQSNCYTLMRRYRTSSQTFAVLSSSTTPLSFEALYKPVDEEVTVEEEIASYVWDFHVRWLDTAEGAYVEKPNAEQALDKILVTYSDRLPLWIEVRFKALGTRAAARLHSMAVGRETWSDKHSKIYQRMILPCQQQFVARIPISAPH